MSNKQEAIENEHPYICVPSFQEPNYDGKITELLVRVKRIEAVMVKVNNSLAKPSIPPKPTDRRHSTSTDAGIGSKHGDSLIPPPRPPRSPINKARREKVFRKSDCDFLQAQLLCVRGYLDSMVDDDFDDKREHMMALDSVVGALACD